MAIVTLTTDFGLGKYVGSMKGVILGINPQATIVDLHHDVRPQAIREGAFVLFDAVRFFPPAVHVAVVDPGVGTDRKDIIVACERGTLVGPDNGLLLPAARALGLHRVYEIRNPKFLPKAIHPTFHGRDILAPAAAHLSLGVDPEALGPEVKECVDLDFGRPSTTANEIRGNVIYVDRFGNVITNVPREVLEGWTKAGENIVVQVGGRGVVAAFLQAYGFAPRGQALVTISSADFVEVAVNQGNAAQFLGVREGAAISLARA